MEKEGLALDSSSQRKIQILFSGLCAFVGSRESREPVEVLLLDAPKSPMKKRLCKHDPVLLFPEHQLVDGKSVSYLVDVKYPSGPRDSRLKSFSSHEYFDKERILGLRDLYGYGLSFRFLNGVGAEIGAGSEGVEWDESMSKVIDLDRMLKQKSGTATQGVVARKFKDSNFIGKIIASRVRVEAGSLVALNLYSEKVSLYSEDDKGDAMELAGYMENVVLTIDVPSGARHFVMDLSSNGKIEQSLIFLSGSLAGRIPAPTFAISNLCGPEFDESPRIGRDFASYYDLMDKPPKAGKRRLIHTVIEDSESGEVGSSLELVKSGSGHCAPGSATWS